MSCYVLDERRLIPCRKNDEFVNRLYEKGSWVIAVVMVMMGWYGMCLVCREKGELWDMKYG